MNRSLKSARPDSSTYSTSRRIDSRLGALAQAAARRSSRPRRRRCRPRRSAAARSLRHQPDADRAERRQVARRSCRRAAPARCRAARRRARAAGSPSRSRSRPWRTAARARRAGRGTPSSAASSPRQCSTNTRSSPIFVEPRRRAPGASSAASSSGMKRPEWSSSPACDELGDGVDEPGAADPDRLGVADHVELELRRRRSRTPSIAPSAARMPQRICAASNAGPAGRARSRARARPSRARSRCWCRRR